MQTTAQWADEIWRKGIAPEPQLTVSEWADRHRMLPPISAEPGPWRTDRTPYLRDIMDALSVANPVERVVFMKGAQLGATEAGLNWLGYVIHHAPGLMLMVMPSIDMIRRNTTTRIDPLIESTPVLAERVAPARSRDSGNTTNRKKFPGGYLVMTGANSTAGLRSTPARFIFLDEVDGYPADADGEGDPVALAIQRTVTFRGRRKIFLVSTPTLKGFSRIEAAYQESDQRRYFVPCIHCGEFQTIEWAQIIWPKGKRHEAAFVCRECGGVHEEHHKPQLLARGEWRATAKGDGRTAGFHLSSLYSPFETWAEIATEHGLVRRDPPRLKTWVNTKLGETWEDEASELPKVATLMARRELFGDLLPADVVILTAGVDVQGNRLEIQVVGWGADQEAWIIMHSVLWGDPARPDVWRDLDRALLSTFPHSRQVGDLAVRAVAVDTGGDHTAEAYDFCRQRFGRRVWGIKGRGGQGIPLWPRKPSRSKIGNTPLFSIGVDAAKDTLAARLRIDEAGPGCIHFPLDLNESFFAQLTAERAITKYKMGRPQRAWEPIRSGERNEALDCHVYAMAALHGLLSSGLRLNVEATRLAGVPLKGGDHVIAAPVQTATPTVIRSAWLER